MGAIRWMIRLHLLGRAGTIGRDSGLCLTIPKARELLPSRWAAREAKSRGA